jgi:predicted RNA-binding Zn ribbon-like protein
LFRHTAPVQSDYETPQKVVNNGVSISLKLLGKRNSMPSASQNPGDWIDGFLFVGNRLALDFLNTRPVLPQGPAELLPDVPALERWLIASGIARSPKTRSLLRSWRHSPAAAAFLRELIGFRERLRDAVVHLEAGAPPSEEFLHEINEGFLRHPRTSVLRRRDGRVQRELLFDPQRPSDLWAPILDGTAELLTEPDSRRIRQCEACVLHFFDSSKKGSRRWCSMNICGNRLKVAAYQRRQRKKSSVR